MKNTIATFIFIFSGMIIVFGLSMISLGLAPALIAGVAGIFWLVIAGLAVLYNKSENQANKLYQAQIQSENYLVKWEYKPAEWRAYLEATRNSLKTVQPLLYVGVMLLIIMVLFVTVGVGLGRKGERNVDIVFSMIVEMGLVAAIGMFLYYWLQYRRRSKKVADDIYIWLEGIYQDDKFEPFRGLRSVELIEESPLDVLKFNCTTTTTNGSTYYSIRVGVPGEKKAEARRLLQVFNSNSLEEREKLLAELKEVYCRPR